MKLKYISCLCIINLAAKAQSLTANFTVNPNCIDTAICFHDLSISTNNPITSWAWGFGDGSSNCCTHLNPCHYYAFPGTFTVTLIVTDSIGNTNTINKSVTVYPLPTVTCHASPDTINQFSGVSNFFSSANGVASNMSYTWTPASGISSQCCPVTSANPTVTTCYTVTVTDTNGCVNSCNLCLYVIPSSNKNELNMVNAVNISPNPFSSTASFSLEKEFKNATVMISDNLGQIVREIKNVNGKNFTVHRDDLPNGIYFINVLQEGQINWKQKLIISD